jgi:trans-aconitate methyltransferase
MRKLYDELAGWFHLVTAPADYREEAAEIVRVVEAEVPDARTLLELGSGGGNNASHLKARFECTLTDLSEPMLALSRGLNPECEHLQGDMRTLRLGRTFDAVLVHDAIVYMTTEADLRAAFATAFAHVRPGGVAVLIPDCVRETLVAETRHGGHDGDGRSLRYLEWVHETGPTATTYDVDFAFVLREDGADPRVVLDRHVCGVFGEQDWLAWLREAGFEPRVERLEVEDTVDWRAFVARRPR